MNKARMTIRFDQETPEGQVIQSEFGPRNKPVEFPIEIMDKHKFIVRENNRSNNSRTTGGLADERRRLEPMQNESLYSEEWAYDRNEAPLMNEGEVDQQGYFHDMPKEDNHHFYLSESGSSTNDYGYYRSRKPNSLWKVAGSIAGAVITGVLFGTVVLSMFNGGDKDNDLSTSEINPSGTVSSMAGDIATNEVVNNQAESVPASVAVAIPEQTFYLLQYGVFSSAERAEQAKGELTQSGIAAFGDSSAENRVYAGVSPDREQAKLLSSQLKNEGVELYVREITLPGAQSAIFAGEAAALDIFFETSGELTTKLSSLSASLLGLQSPEPVDADTMNMITGLHLQWMEAVKLVSSGMNPEIEINLTAMTQEMSGAITALTEYNKNRSQGHLWEIQEGMMKYIMGQRKLVESLSL